MNSGDERLRELRQRLSAIPLGERERELERQGVSAELRERVADLLQVADRDPSERRDASAPCEATLDYPPPSADAPATQEFLSASTGPPTINKSDTTPKVAGRGSHSGQLLAGRYALVEKIGEGGMGEVWVAEQSEPVKRRVALKLIKTGMDSRSVLQRFEQERQALAVMDHPQIARVFDGGITPSGQPFFVMELVGGPSLTRFCDDEQLSLRDRLELFIPICQAVQHAHQKGIVHRDLKPANILVAMVDGRPVPKVIDFGVAKAVSGKLLDETLATGHGGIVGTWEYMSPEQAGMSGQDIDTRSDIYALGVVLYELLTGLRPFDGSRLRQLTLTELIRVIQEEEPPRPSTRLSTADRLSDLAAHQRIDPRRLQSLLRGELDWVVMKCLEKSRERRYESASDLARDVQRYLSNEPVEARPPSVGYRLRKFVVRHRPQVLGAALLLGALIAGVIGTSWGLIDARRARDAEAQQKQAALAAADKEAAERKRAEDTLSMMETVFDNLDPNSERERGISLKDQLVANLTRITERFAAAPGDPLVRARLQYSVGKTLTGLSEYRQAEEALRQALAARRESLGESAPDTLDAALALAVALEHDGRFAEAIELVEQVREQSGSKDRSRHDWDHMIGMIYQAAGDLDQAIARFESARDAEAAQPSADPRTALLIAHTLGASYREQGRNHEAIAILDKVAAERERLLGADNPDTIYSLNSLAAAYANVGREAEAIKLYQDVLERVRRRYGPLHVTAFHAENNLYVAQVGAGSDEQRVRRLEELRERATTKLGPEDPCVLNISRSLASAYHEQQRYSDAASLLRDLIPKYAALFGAESQRVAEVKLSCARALVHGGQAAEAVELLESSLSQLKESRGLDHPIALRLQVELARASQDSKDPERSLAALREIVERQRRVLGAEHPDTLESLEALGIALYSARRAADAIAVFEPLAEARARAVGPNHRNTLRVQSSLGAAYWATKQLNRSIPLIEETLKRQVETLGREHRDTLATAANLLANYNSPEYKSQTYELLRDFLPLFVRQHGLEHPLTGTLVPAFVQHAREQGRMADTVPTLEAANTRVIADKGRDSEEALQIANNLAAAYWNAGQLDKSIPLFVDLIERSQRILGANDPRTVQAQASMGRNLLDAGRIEEALRALVEANQKGRDSQGKLRAELEFIASHLAEAQARSGQADEARETIREALAAARKRNPRPNRALAGALSSLGLSLLLIGDCGEAETIFRESLEIRQSVDPEHWNTSSTKSLLGAALLDQKKYADAEPLLLEGNDGLRAKLAALPHAGRERYRESIQRLIRLYEETERPDQVERWKRELENASPRASQIKSPD